MVNQRFVDLKKIIVGLVIISPIFVSPAVVLGYNDQTTHRALTNEAAKVFNHYYPDQALTIDEVGSLIKGSFEEDKAPRWLNHFYDPVYNRGLRGLFSSKNWAQNTELQGLRLPTSNLVREYFNDPTDYSWERAIYDYVYGDQSRGLEALGHVMHLTQDATVPDHTRDDMHPIWSTYENYTKQFDLFKIDLARGLIAQNHQPLIYPDLGSYFDNLATFANNNFFSDDTILIKKYSKPIVLGEVSEKLSDGKNVLFGTSEFGKLTVINESYSRRTGSKIRYYTLIDVDKKIPADYWSHLSEKAVLGSAGVIKLFFDEVEKEKETKRLFEKNKSLVKRVWEKIEVGIEKVKAQFGSLLANAISILPGTLEIRSDPDPDVEDIVVEMPAVGETGSAEVEEIDESEAQQIAELLAVIENLKRRIEVVKQQQAEQSAGVLADATVQTLSAIQPLIIYDGSSSGGGGSGGAVAVVTSEIVEVATVATTSEAVTLESPIILAPADLSQIFATTTIIFSGTASSGLIIFNDFNETLATVDELGEWQTEISDLAQGSSTISFYARDEAGHVSLPAVVSFHVDSLPLSVNLEIEECEHSFVIDSCVLAPVDPLNLTWTVSKPGDYEYELLKIFENRGDWESTSISSTQDQNSSIETGLVAGGESIEWRWQVLVRLVGAEEIIASSTEVSTHFHPRPLVINEIGWAGTTASTTDEWIELHNYLDETIDLTGYYLIDMDNNWQINLSGSISAGDYYLIERTNDEVISNRSANLVAGWGADSVEKGFNPTRLGLRLYRTISIGEQVVDETPVWDKSSASPGSLERTFENKVSTDLSTWEENTGCDDNCALDRNGDQTFGTPGQMNIASVPNLF